MNAFATRYPCTLVCAFVIYSFLSGSAQAESITSAASMTPRTTDAITLQGLMAQALATHPSVRAARVDQQAAQQDVETARLQRWPVLSATLESRDSNVATTSARALSLEQILWDGGRVAARVAETSSISEMGVARIQALRQELALQVIGAWQTWVSAQGRAAIADATIKQLGDYRERMRRRVEAQASPLIELDLVEARLLQTQVELNQARANARIAVAKLEQLTGWSGLEQRLASDGAMAATDNVRQQAAEVIAVDVDAAADRAPAVAMARAEAQAARSRLDQKQAEKYPQLYLRLNQPIAGGTVGNQSLAVFVGLRYSPGAGFSQLSETKSVALRAQSAEESIDLTRREAANALRADTAELAAALDRLPAAESSVAGGDRVLESYLRQFAASRKTWQDVLNAARELAQNKYSQVDIQASLLGALYRLWVRLGRFPGLEPVMQGGAS